MRSTEPAGSFAISAAQSPSTMGCCGLSETPRGAREGAPRRDTTMTQYSDSGDAVGDAGPTTDRPAIWSLKVKKRFMRRSYTGQILPIVLRLSGAFESRKSGRIGRNRRIRQ